VIHHDRPNLTAADMANMALADVGITDSPCYMATDDPGRGKQYLGWNGARSDRAVIHRAGLLALLRERGPNHPTRCHRHAYASWPSSCCTVADALLGRTCQDVTP